MFTNASYKVRIESQGIDTIIRFKTPTQLLFYVYQKLQASSLFLGLYRPVCVGHRRNPNAYLFSHAAVYMVNK